MGGNRRGAEAELLCDKTGICVSIEQIRTQNLLVLGFSLVIISEVLISHGQQEWPPPAALNPLETSHFFPISLYRDMSHLTPCNSSVFLKIPTT